MNARGLYLGTMTFMAFGLTVRGSSFRSRVCAHISFVSFVTTCSSSRSGGKPRLVAARVLQTAVPCVWYADTGLAWSVEGKGSDGNEALTQTRQISAAAVPAGVPCSLQARGIKPADERARGLAPPRAATRDLSQAVDHGWNFGHFLAGGSDGDVRVHDAVRCADLSQPSYPWP